MVDIDVLNYSNKIMMSIGETFLTAPEQTILPGDISNKQSIFEALFKILQDRKVNQTSFDRLKAKAMLENVGLPDNIEKKVYSSNIALGFGVDL